MRIFGLRGIMQNCKLCTVLLKTVLGHVFSFIFVVHALIYSAPTEIHIYGGEFTERKCGRKVFNEMRWSNVDLVRSWML